MHLFFRTQYGKFDAIWDSQSFTAINLEDHEGYLNICLKMTRDKANNFAFASSEDVVLASDQSEQSSLISVFTVHMKKT